MGCCESTPERGSGDSRNTRPRKAKKRGSQRPRRVSHQSTGSGDYRDRSIPLAHLPASRLRRDEQAIVQERYGGIWMG